MMALHDILVGLLLMVGAIFAFAASMGLLRLKDVYQRMHAASKAGTLGSGLMLIGLGIYALDLGVFARAFAGFCFFILTAPVAAHLIARAAYSVGYRPTTDTVIDPKVPAQPQTDLHR
ncbi:MULTISPECIES: monovalent cation/H(+) antiporter subunit G [Pseudovibrio]|uniref:monovalent cation/H(+) antiporter subunit G n=1 Tax=Stappiaceae TaxID=2821832 RepID=UPI0023655ECD|nr:MULTISPECIES: monovalent cation/H(+) antiporter subunit G [Pseudovibrio]MDD7909168.1 monovalent cation/H(+) antiporter subunit G [Pseudovibrio exalbescens]MDX5595613.1 monovalent cation/H(+) antiporter subunit G [Pseudovibrio sp. SPO723]